MSQNTGRSAPSPSECPYAPRPPVKVQAKAGQTWRRLVDQPGLWLLVSVGGLALLADLLVLPLMKVFDERDWAQCGSMRAWA